MQYYVSAISLVFFEQSFRSLKKPRSIIFFSNWNINILDRSRYGASDHWADNDLMSRPTQLRATNVDKQYSFEYNDCDFSPSPNSTLLRGSRKKSQVIRKCSTPARLDEPRENKWQSAVGSKSAPERPKSTASSQTAAGSSIDDLKMTVIGLEIPFIGWQLNNSRVDMDMKKIDSKGKRIFQISLSGKKLRISILIQIIREIDFDEESFWNRF